MKVFCITIPESKHRERLDKEAERVCLTVNWWNGVNGESFGLKTFIPTHTDWIVGPKYVGLYLSHWALWRVLEAVDADEILILEDDAEFHPGFVDLWPSFYSELPSDWQLVYVGSCCVRNNSYAKISEHICVAKNPMGTHAYMIKKSALPIIIERMNCVQHPLDQDIIKRLLPVLKHYTFIPSLIRQHENSCFTDPEWIF